MGDAPEIRPAAPEDAASLADLWLEFSREMAALDDYNELADPVDRDLHTMQTDWRHDRLAEDDYRAFLAETPEAAAEAPNPVGYVAAERSVSPPVFARDDQLTVNEIFVREPYRGQGLADRLLDRAIAWGRERGCGRASLSVNVANDRARAFYDRRGFEPRRLTLDRPLE